MDFSANPALTTEDKGEKHGLCEPCRKKLGSLQDRSLDCARPGCTGSFAWSREQQLEAFAQNRRAPGGLCAACQALEAGLQSKDVPCVVPGCENTATLSPRQQLMDVGGAATPNDAPVEAAPEETGTAGAGPDETADTKPQTDLDADDHRKHKGVSVAGPMCPRCDDTVPRLRDRDVPCGINQCKRKWTWTADEQMAAFIAGKPPQPPRRMCTECREAFGGLVDRQVRCRASGCKNHWTWSREDQFDACSANKPVPKPPSHLCERCFKIWAELKDVERPCRQAGCANTWTDKRGAQLARALRGKTGDPYPQYCAQHAHLVEQLQDREVPCKIDGCNQTWTWTRNQQLAAGVRPEPLQPNAQDGHGAPNTNGEANGTGDGAGHAPEAEVVQAGAATEPAPQTDAGAPSDAGTVGPADQENASTAVAGGQEPGRRRRRNKKKRKQIQPPARQCARCAEFLASHKTIELPCSQCGTPIFWPPESQLQTDLGNWEIPKLCGACKRDVTEAERQRAREELRQRATQQGAVEGTAPAETAVATPDTPPPAEETSS